MRILVSLSGGMDSGVCLAHLLAQGHTCGAVTFAYGAKHEAAEVAAARALVAHYKIKSHFVIDLSVAFSAFKSALLQGSTDGVPRGHYEEESMKATVVPFRNGIMLSVAAGLAESNGFDAVALGSHAGDHAIYPDCRLEWVESMRCTIRLGTWAGVDLMTPVQGFDKVGICRRALDLAMPLGLTHTCYNGVRPACGACGACIERAEAFRTCGAVDPLTEEVTR